MAGSKNQFRLYLGSVVACVIGLEAGAVLVPIQISFWRFNCAIYQFSAYNDRGHLITGVIEGVITATVVAYIVQVRPQMLADEIQSKFSILPDYTIRTKTIGLVNEDGEMTAGWTSFAGVCGAFMTMLVIAIVSRIARREKDSDTVNNTQLA